MAESLTSIAAMGFLVYMARKMSEPVNEYYKGDPTPVQSTPLEYNQETETRTQMLNTMSGNVLEGSKMEIENKFDMSNRQYVHGRPVEDFRNRPYVSSIQNNLNPIEKVNVGPGLAVGPDVPAYGGFQQHYRVRPNNVGGYKLTTLPGRSGPAGDITGGRAPIWGEVGYNHPEKTAFLPSRLPSVPGQAQGQGGELDGGMVRGEYEKTKRTTNRSETGLRSDGLSFGGANRFIPLGQSEEAPTRNKGDDTRDQFFHIDNPSPGITSFYEGYTSSATGTYLENRDSNMSEFGLRVADKKGNAGRTGNAGRMNVRAGPLNQGGKLTAVRTDTTRIDGRVNPIDGGWTQEYTKPLYQDLNAYKGTQNPHATSDTLSIAKRQMAQNPLASVIN